MISTSNLPSPTVPSHPSTYSLKTSCSTAHHPVTATRWAAVTSSSAPAHCCQSSSGSTSGSAVLYSTVDGSLRSRITAPTPKRRNGSPSPSPCGTSSAPEYSISRLPSDNGSGLGPGCTWNESHPVSRGLITGSPPRNVSTLATHSTVPLSGWELLAMLLLSFPTMMPFSAAQYRYAAPPVVA